MKEYTTQEILSSKIDAESIKEIIESTDDIELFDENIFNSNTSNKNDNIVELNYVEK